MKLHTSENTELLGANSESAGRGIVLIHGRGATAMSIVSLMNEFTTENVAVAAPQATNNTWYPYSFLKPESENEPWLQSAIGLVGETVEKLKKGGLAQENIIIMGFSQGACLGLEFAARTGGKFGGVVAFSGGLIGDKITPGKYAADLNQTPVFIGCSDNDFHIPESRVHDSASMLEKLNAKVESVIYPGMGHTIIMDEILKAQRIIDQTPEAERAI
ncbi:MAG: dienelactone hydrolase family protein [Balneolales bacterium]|nr:dienelactone hydrolase family protein [Balneolales bacterium]